MGECFCFGSEAVNASGKASPLANFSRAPPPLAHPRIPPATQAIKSVTCDQASLIFFVAVGRYA